MMQSEFGGIDICTVGELTLNLIKMIMACWKQNIQDGSVSIFLELQDHKDL
jgi:hypothetical protein